MASASKNDGLPCLEQIMSAFIFHIARKLNLETSAVRSISISSAACNAPMVALNSVRLCFDEAVVAMLGRITNPHPPAKPRFVHRAPTTPTLLPHDGAPGANLTAVATLCTRNERQPDRGWSLLHVQGTPTRPWLVQRFKK